MNNYKIMNTPYDYYKQFPGNKSPKYDSNFFLKNISKLQEELEKINVLFYFMKWGERSIYAGHWGIIIEEVNKILDNNPDKYNNGVIFYSECLLYFHSVHKDKKNEDGILFLAHQNINNEVKIKINEIFKEIFPKRTLGITHYNEKIKIYFEEQTCLIQNKSHQLLYIRLNFINEDYNADDIYIDISNKIMDLIGDTIINDLINRHSFKGEVIYFYEIYDDKIDEFVMKIKNIDIPYKNLIKNIIIGAGDKQFKNIWQIDIK